MNATSTLEVRVRAMIGDLMVNNASLMMQLEECQKEIIDLKAKLGEGPAAPASTPEA